MSAASCLVEAELQSLANIASCIMWEALPTLEELFIPSPAEQHLVADFKCN